MPKYNTYIFGLTKIYFFIPKRKTKKVEYMYLKHKMKYIYNNANIIHAFTHSVMYT